MIKRVRFSAFSIALGYVTVSLVVLALFATPLWYAWRHSIEAAWSGVLQADAQRLKNIVVKRGVDELAKLIAAQVGNQPDASGKIILLTDSALHKRAGNLTAWPRGLGNSPLPQSTVIDLGARRMHAATLQENLPGGYLLLVGLDIDQYEKVEALFVYGLLGSGAAVLLVAILGGIMIRRVLLSKIDVINQTTSAIVKGDLSRRLPALPYEDELETLTGTLNRMLDQIEHLVLGIRNVSNSIAHDLRTPLAELRSRLEELSVTQPEPEQTFSEIDDAIADVDRVIAIFNALLRLAEIDAGTRRAGFVPVDAATIAREAAEFYQPVAELRGVALAFVSNRPLIASGDPLLLAQAVGNLIDNASKYARAKVLIEARMSNRRRNAIEIAVSDDGPGIPDEEKSKVLERFYRGDASRGTPGVGLGLSLVAAVAALHGGALVLADSRPGLTATLILRADFPRM